LTARAAAREQCYTFSFEHDLGGASVPLYEYKCVKCGRNTEKIENVSGPHLKKCPHCGGKVESVITAPAIQFKGAGWYVTDYGGKKSGASDGDNVDKPATTEAKDSASKEKESPSKDSSSKDSKESKEKKPAKKK
jgi:putative FmdB family regulatory protein